mmetsp:Transcript_68669/g.210576  ORF Transcript_68669/g.210576 Transcript_68669/m.210576 type:complete len:280 (+) Transcript_68669:552-1391(+)
MARPGFLHRGDWVVQHDVRVDDQHGLVADSPRRPLVQRHQVDHGSAGVVRAARRHRELVQGHLLWRRASRVHAGALGHSPRGICAPDEFDDGVRRLRSLCVGLRERGGGHADAVPDHRRRRQLGRDRGARDRGGPDPCVAHAPERAHHFAGDRELDLGRHRRLGRRRSREGRGGADQEQRAGAAEDEAGPPPHLRYDGPEPERLDFLERDAGSVGRESRVQKDPRADECALQGFGEHLPLLGPGRGQQGVVQRVRRPHLRHANLRRAGDVDHAPGGHQR